MDCQKLYAYIWQGIRKEVRADRIELFIPFFFSEGSDAPLCLTFHADGVLSDGGRTMSELKKRLGDIGPYMDMIRNILLQCGDCRLVGGQNIIKDSFQTVVFGEDRYQDYLGGMNYMLMAISRISIVDQLVALNGKGVS